MKAIVKGKVLYYAYEVDISEISYAFDKFSKNVMVVNADRMSASLKYLMDRFLKLKHNKNACIGKKIIRCDYEKFDVFPDIDYIYPKGSIVSIKDKQYTIEDVYTDENEVVYHTDYILREYKSQDEYERVAQEAASVIDDNIEFVKRLIKKFNNDGDLVVKDKKWWQFWK